VDSSPTTVVKRRSSRRSSWPAARPFIIIGVGGIGSVALSYLVKLGVREFILYDHDRVEAANNPNQAYVPVEVDLLKIEAAADILSRNGATSVTVHPHKYTGQDPLEGIVLCGVDSIDARKTIWPYARYNPLVELYFDGRLGGEQLRLLTVRPNDPTEVECYERSFFSAEKTAELPCGGRAIIGPAGILAGILTGQLTRYIRDEPFKNDIRFHLGTMQLLTGRWSA
jgi:molybdopterin/thiamine biosynthesis adenylyltransferase